MENLKRNTAITVKRKRGRPKLIPLTDSDVKTMLRDFMKVGMRDFMKYWKDQGIKKEFKMKLLVDLMKYVVPSASVDDVTLTKKAKSVIQEELEKMDEAV